MFFQKKQNKGATNHEAALMETLIEITVEQNIINMEVKKTPEILVYFIPSILLSEWLYIYCKILYYNFFFQGAMRTCF